MRPSTGRDVLSVLAIAAGAMALRLAYALALAPDLHGLGDDIFYRSAAFELAAGEGYRGGLEAFFGSTWPSAAHPPLYPLVLSVLPRLGVEGVAAMRSVNVVFGSVAVLLTGLVASRLGGRRAAVAAASICAVFPSLVAADATLMAETLFGVLVMGAVLVALWAIERP